MSAVAVVTDSTSYLPRDLADQLGVRVVPLHVSIDGRSGRDGIDIGSAEVTLGPARSPGGHDLAAVAGRIRRGLPGGPRCRARRMSFRCTCRRPCRAPGTRPGWRPRTSATARFGWSIPGRPAWRSGSRSSRRRGRRRLVRRRPRCRTPRWPTVDRTRAFFYVDTLEYLRRGGRIGSAAALVGTSLSVKPLLHMSDGRIVLLERVRTSTKALARLLQITLETAGSATVDIAVQHLDAAEQGRRTDRAAAGGDPAIWVSCTRPRSVRSSGRTSVPASSRTVVVRQR